MATGYLGSGYGAHDTVRVDHREVHGNGLPILNSGLGGLENASVIKGLIKQVILLHLAIGSDFRSDFRTIENLRVIQTLGLPVLNHLPQFEHIHPANHLIDGTKAELGHGFAHLLSHKVHEIHHRIGSTGKFLSKARVLGGDTNGTGILVADPHHKASQGYQGSGGKTEFLGSKQAGNRNVAASLELPVGLKNDSASKVVEEKSLVGFRQPKLPGGACMLNGGSGRGPGSAIIARNQNDVGLGLSHAGGDRAHAHLRDELDVYPCMNVGVLEVMDQLGKILDRVDVMVRGGRN